MGCNEVDEDRGRVAEGGPGVDQRFEEHKVDGILHRQRVELVERHRQDRASDAVGELANDFGEEGDARLELFVGARFVYLIELAAVEDAEDVAIHQVNEATGEGNGVVGGQRLGEWRRQGVLGEERRHGAGSHGSKGRAWKASELARWEGVHLCGLERSEWVLHRVQRVLNGVERGVHGVHRA